MDPLAVVIVHWNAPDACAAAIDAFRAQGLPLDIRIVDNGSGASELERLRRFATGCRILPLHGNGGFAGGANAGLRTWLESEAGEFVVVAAHDALPDTGCLAALLDVARLRPEVGILCPEYGDHRLLAFSVFRGAILRPGSRPAGWEPAPLPHGTLMLLRRQCLLETGLFDERYFAYGEAEDLGLRAARAGWRAAIVWGAVVRNPVRIATTRVAGYLQLRNSINLVRVHRGRLAAALRTAVALGNTPLLHLMRRRHLLAQDLPTRWLAIRDGWRGAWGPPPDRVTR